jgi:hypothetical protein
MDDQTLTHVIEAAEILGISITRRALEQLLYAHAFAVRMVETGRPLDAEITASFAAAPRCACGYLLDGNGVCRTCEPCGTCGCPNVPGATPDAGADRQP